MSDSRDGEGHEADPIDAAKAMLPTLRLILATVIAACAAVLAMSAGILGTHDPGEHLAGVPSMSRPMVRQAIVEDSEWQRSQVLAYTRRADELQRLRDLPITPVHALVEYAERAQKAAEEKRASAPVATPAPAPTIDAAEPAAPSPVNEPTAVDAAPSAPPAAQPAPAVIASAASTTPAPDAPPVIATGALPAETPTTTPAEAPAAVPAETPASPPVASLTEPATSPSPQIAPTIIASTPAATPAEAPASVPIETPAPQSVASITEAPAASSPQVAPIQTPEPATVANEATQVASVQSGSGETAAVKPTEKQAEAKSHHRPRTHAHRETHKAHEIHKSEARKKKEKAARVARTTLPPAGSTGFPVDLPTTSKSGTSDSTPVAYSQQDMR
jgi:hypothetical protein